ncbi:unnamed protein product [Symbiodinium sp. CCMP2592]|nr:unnamed protein product [Symbiodinium sp. CCMP2592]
MLVPRLRLYFASNGQAGTFPKTVLYKLIFLSIACGKQTCVFELFKIVPTDEIPHYLVVAQPRDGNTTALSIQTCTGKKSVSLRLWTTAEAHGVDKEEVWIFVFGSPNAGQKETLWFLDHFHGLQFAELDEKGIVDVGVLDPPWYCEACWNQLEQYRSHQYLLPWPNYKFVRAQLEVGISLRSTLLSSLEQQIVIHPLTEAWSQRAGKAVLDHGAFKGGDRELEGGLPTAAQADRGPKAVGFKEESF